ncbi:hypothetical protein KUTeg_015760 [Tegillarca granosa]|uniref:B box-type domain-containing protein n=1 Tax=Tegillarca granosa TaxID=220873 RepID=A0ABQ9EP35_TEGGR|nr:hypothetical protein KUTeg_015760 [Tegillarca granosa]
MGNVQPQKLVADYLPLRDEIKVQSVTESSELENRVWNEAVSSIRNQNVFLVFIISSETCLNSYIITAFKSESESKDGKSNFNCPVCRRMVTLLEPNVKYEEWAKQFPLNHLIVSLMDQNKLKTKEKLCDPCKSTDDDVTAVSWCLECNEAFCQVCASLHKKQKMSKHHAIKNIEEMQEVPPISPYEVCENHKGKIIEAFCIDHNQPCCTTCITIHHRKCDQVTTLEDAANGVLDSNDLSELLQRLKDTSALHLDLVKDKREIIKKLEDQKGAIEKELQDTRQKIIDSFDQSHSSLMQGFTQTHNRKLQELISSIQDSKNRNKNIQNYINLMETCKRGCSESQVFLEMKKVQEREKEQLEELEQILAKHENLDYKFSLDDNVQKLITQLQTLGHIDVTQKASLAVPRYPTFGRENQHTIDYINIPSLTVNKTKSLGVWCGGITSSDNKLYVGCKNKLLKLDKDGNKEKEINTNGFIKGVTIINQEEKKIVYTDYDKPSCHFVRASDLQEIQSFTHPDLNNLRGVTSDREGNVYIAEEKSGNVFQLSSDGEFILLAGLDRPRGIRESESKDGKSNFNCPVCRRMVTPLEPNVKYQEWAKQFPLNHLIVSLMDQNKLKTKEKLCDPCKSTDDDVTAVSWCLECTEALCQVCASVHKKQKMTKHHALKNIEEMEEVPPISPYEMCENHKGETIKAFCIDHNKPCCTTCITINHRKCDQVTTLEDAANGVLDSNELSELLQRLKDTSALNLNLITEKKEIIKKLEEQKGVIEKELQDTRQKIIDKFDKLHSSFMQGFTQTHNRKIQELTNSIKDLENRNKSIQNCMNLMETCKRCSSESQVFLEMQKVQEREKEQLQELEQILARHGNLEYNFSLDDDVQKLITQLQTLGQIDVMEKASLTALRYPKLSRVNFKEYMPQLVLSFSIKDKCGVDTWVYGGCFLSDDTLLITLFNGKKLALLNSNGDLIKQSDELPGYVNDVCMLDPTTVVVTQCDDKVIDFINIPTLTVNKTVSVGVWCGGITSSDNKLYVGCKNKLLILDKDGNKQKEINTNGYIFGVTIINQGEKKIVYTTYSKNSCHFVRASDLQEIQRFTHPELKSPRGVTSDREGNVYIVGESLGNVFQLSSDGEFIRILLTGLDRPHGIRFDDKSDRFFVSYSDPKLTSEIDVRNSHQKLTSEIDVRN